MDYNINNSMTELMFQSASEKTLTIEQASAKLYECAYIRTVNETLARFYNIDKNDIPSLRKKTVSLLLESTPSANKESVEKKVRNWLNGKKQFISKESALQLIFGLHLSTQDAEEMMWHLCGEKFHWRDPEDIVWLYAIEHDMNYAEACVLLTKITEIYESAKSDTEDQSTMTESIRKLVMQIKDENELETFIRENAPQLGKLHNTAFDLFKAYMNILQSAPSPVENNLPDARRMSVNEVVVTYLYNNLIPRGKRENNSKKRTDTILKDAIQRDIQQNWPDEFTLARIANREIDVTRKVLILLFLACDGGETDYGYYADGYFAEGSPADIFEDTYARLESMLNDCGFAPLDPRIPFDWMVLYSIGVDDILDIDENISHFLSEIFKNSMEE